MGKFLISKIYLNKVLNKRKQLLLLGMECLLVIADNIWWD